MSRFMKNEEDDFDEFYENDYRDLLNQQNALEGFHLHLMEKNISEKVLSRSIKVCENSFFWKFYSINSKLSAINKVYDSFINILKIEE